MTTRRDFVKNSIVSIGGLSMGPKLLSYSPSDIEDDRPSKRKFSSEIIDSVVSLSQKNILDRI